MPCVQGRDEDRKEENGKARQPCVAMYDVLGQSTILLEFVVPLRLGESAAAPLAEMSG